MQLSRKIAHVLSVPLCVLGLSGFSPRDLWPLKRIFFHHNRTALAFPPRHSQLPAAPNTAAPPTMDRKDKAKPGKGRQPNIFDFFGAGKKAAKTKGPHPPKRAADEGTPGICNAPRGHNNSKRSKSSHNADAPGSSAKPPAAASRQPQPPGAAAAQRAPHGNGVCKDTQGRGVDHEQARVLLLELRLDQVDVLLRRLGRLADVPVGLGRGVASIYYIILFYG